MTDYFKKNRKRDAGSELLKTFLRTRFTEFAFLVEVTGIRLDIC